MAQKHGQQKHSAPAAAAHSPKISRLWIGAGLVALAAVIYLLATSGQPPQPTAAVPVTVIPEEKPVFRSEGSLTFTSRKTGKENVLDIEIADTESRRTLGLMYRDSMAEHQGMLFVFPQEDDLAFWMKHTRFSLDMFFVNASNEIVTIHAHTTPYSTESYASTKKALYVVETVAGYAERHGLREGDTIRWKRN